MLAKLILVTSRPVYEAAHSRVAENSFGLHIDHFDDAVVAQEVKTLAAQTAKATDEFSTQIVGMQSATAESVSAIREIGGTIGHIFEIAGAIAAAVEQQGAATQEIARNVSEAAKGTRQVFSNITGLLTRPARHPPKYSRRRIRSHRKATG